jgi:hypothetical protein
MPAQEELDNAIAEAEEAILAEVDKGLNPEDKVDDKIDDDKDDAVTSDDDELNETQIKEARTLYKLLLDPKQRMNIVAALAQDSGLLNQLKVETPKQVEKAEASIAKLIEEALPEYPGLSTKLGPVIEKIVEAERESRAAEMQQIHVQNVEKEVISELSALATDTKGASRKLESKMVSLMNEVQPGENVTTKSYIRMLYTLAAAGGQKALVSANIADKIRRNSNNAADRLKTGSGAARTNEMPTKKMSLNDSVNWAINKAFEQANGKK